MAIGKLKINYKTRE